MTTAIGVLNSSAAIFSMFATTLHLSPGHGFLQKLVEPHASDLNSTASVATKKINLRAEKNFMTEFQHRRLVVRQTTRLFSK
jgi:hypothetical protein